MAVRSFGDFRAQLMIGLAPAAHRWWIQFSYQFTLFGREFCTPDTPLGGVPLEAICDSSEKTVYTVAAPLSQLKLRCVIASTLSSYSIAQDFDTRN
jgi:hypothetical protein